MKKSLFTIILASLLTLTACSPAADTKENSDVAPTEAATEATTEAVTEATTEAPTEKSTETEIKDISDTQKFFNVYVDGQKIKGAIFLPEGEGPFPTVVMIQGLGISYPIFTDTAKEIAKKGVATVNFDCRGYVPEKFYSEGEFFDMTPSSCVKDIISVTNVISEYPAIDKENIFIWGHSYGGILATMAAVEQPDVFKGFIGLNPAFQMPDEFRNLYNDNTETFILEGGEIGEPLARELMAMDIFETMKSYENNVLILTGTKDAIFIDYPEAYDKAMVSFPNVKKIVEEGADHYYDPYCRDELVQYTVDFVKENTD